MAEEKIPAGLEKISGTVEGIIYQNEENGYAILDLGTEENELITVVGTLPYVGEGDTLTLYGKWVHNPKYGRQFRAEQFEKELPADATAILRYLSSRTVKGIGPKKAQKMVDLFGEDTFDVIENHPDWLTQIPGISQKAANEMSEEFKKQAGVRRVMMFFRDFFGATLSVRIYKTWGNGAVEIAKENPYRLCEEVEGIGFEKADDLAQKIGFDRAGLPRVESGILYLLSYNASQSGHTCLPEDKLYEAACALLGVGREQVEAAVSSLLRERRLFRVHHLTREGSRAFFFDQSSYECERTIAERMVALDRGCVKLDIRDVEYFITREEKKSGICYAGMQKEAIASALENGVMILTGGPGTGKTTVVRALLQIFRSMDLRVALAAPTGRAAKRMSEATSNEAKTVHRLLEMSFNEGKHAEFARNSRNQLEEDVIIVDEVSMMDEPLMAALLRAVKPGARLVLIGDADQLPSVGAGNVLHDLIACGRFATVALTEVFRQARHSLIVTNAHAVNRGEMPKMDAKDNDFFFLSRGSDAEIATTVADLCRNRLPRTYGADIVGNIQVISPSRKGEAGTENLNRILQEALNPPRAGKREHRVRDIVFREGDRVMQIRNNYDLEWERGDESGEGVFNGDIGYIVSLSRMDREMIVEFDDGRRATYDDSMLDELELSYCISVHKSQGSEFEAVVLPLLSGPQMLMTRNLLYTAVTRARRLVVIVGREGCVHQMVDNNRILHRYSALHLRLRAAER